MESSRTELAALQERLAAARSTPFVPPATPLRVAGVFACFGQGGSGPGDAGDVGWGGAAVLADDRLVDTADVTGAAGAGYQPGLLALREGDLLATAIRALEEPFDVLLVNATGRDHPRRAGLATHLGYVLRVASVGVTHRPLLAAGPWPSSDDRGARSPLRIDGELVGYWLRTRSEARPLAVSAGWRTDPDTAADLALASATQARTPEPLRQARRLAREARTRA